MNITENTGSADAIVEEGALTTKIVTVVVALIVTCVVLVPVANGLADANGGGGGGSPSSFMNTGNIYYTDDLGDDVISIYKSIENIGGVDCFVAYVDYNGNNLITTPSIPLTFSNNMEYAYLIGAVSFEGNDTYFVLEGYTDSGYLYIQFATYNYENGFNSLMYYEFEDGDESPYDEFGDIDNAMTLNSMMFSGVSSYLVMSDSTNASHVYAKNPYVTPTTVGVMFKDSYTFEGVNQYNVRYSYYGSMVRGTVNIDPNMYWWDTSDDVSYYPYNDPQTVIHTTPVGSNGVEKFDGLSISFEWDDSEFTPYSEVDQYAIVPITVTATPLPGPSANPLTDGRLIDITDAGFTDGWQIWFSMGIEGNKVVVTWEVEDNNGTRQTEVNVPLNRQAVLFAFYNQWGQLDVCSFVDPVKGDVILDIPGRTPDYSCNYEYLSAMGGQFSFTIYDNGGGEYRFNSDSFGSFYDLSGGYLVSPDGDFALYAPGTKGDNGNGIEGTTALISLSGFPVQMVTDYEYGQAFWFVSAPLQFTEDNKKVYVADFDMNGGGGGGEVVVSYSAGDGLRTTAPADSTLIGNLYYTFTTSGGYYATVTGIDSSLENATSITVPNLVTYNGHNYEVNAVGDYAFQGLTSLQSITFGVSALKTIGDYAFDGCTSLSEGTLPITTATSSIGAYAFQNTAGIAYLDVVCKSYSLGEGAFKNATVRVSADLPYNAINWRNAANLYDSVFEGATFVFDGDYEEFTINLSDPWRVQDYVFADVTLVGFTGKMNFKLDIVGNEMLRGWNLNQVLFYGSDARYAQNPFAGGSIDTVVFTRSSSFSSDTFDGVPVNTFILGGSSNMSILVVGDNAFGTQNGATIIMSGLVYFAYDQDEGTPDSFAGLSNCRIIDMSDRVCESGSDDTYMVPNMRDMGLNSTNTVIDEVPVTALIWKVGSAYQLTNEDNGGSSITGTLIKVVPVFVLIAVLLYAVQFFNPKPY